VNQGQALTALYALIQVAKLEPHATKLDLDSRGYVDHAGDTGGEES